jgi:hypothetical protein
MSACSEHDSSSSVTWSANMKALQALCRQQLFYLLVFVNLEDLFSLRCCQDKSHFSASLSAIWFHFSALEVI